MARRHARIMHPADRQAKQQRGEQLPAAEAGRSSKSSKQHKAHPGGGHSDQHSQALSGQLVVESRLHHHGIDAYIMHDGNPRSKQETASGIAPKCSA
ncbi:hypothetical protein D3C71_1394080 [compost metagenome]